MSKVGGITLEGCPVGGGVSGNGGIGSIWVGGGGQSGRGIWVALGDWRKQDFCKGKDAEPLEHLEQDWGGLGAPGRGKGPLNGDGLGGGWVGRREIGLADDKGE